MILPLSLRKYFFWLVDKIKKGEVNSHFKEISQILKAPTSIISLEIRNRNLANLLAHASNTTAFYKSYKKTKVITDFPVIKKTDIQNNFEEFQSELYKNKTNYKVSTSGSTGVPFFLYQDKNKRNRNRADVIYFFKRSGFEIGNKLYELEVWREHNKKGSIKSWIQNIVQFDVSRLTDSRISEFLNLLRQDTHKNKTILGFASALEIITQYVEKHKIKTNDFKLNPIIANSEYLTPYTKIMMGKYFNTQILSRYSSEEIGIIAQQTVDSTSHFVINHASYHVEVLHFDNDTPVGFGEYGRIIVTDLFNYCMPIIRYDTGDIAKLIELKDGQTKFEKIEGRKMDLIFDTKGNIISSFVVYTKFYNYYTLLKQYQFIQQNEKEYEVKLNAIDTFHFEKELVENIKKDFGGDAKVTITYVDEIPLLSSGKRKKVINNYQKT